jgi:hypothetical protein
VDHVLDYAGIVLAIPAIGTLILSIANLVMRLDGTNVPDLSSFYLSNFPILLDVR